MIKIICVHWEDGEATKKKNNEKPIRDEFCETNACVGRFLYFYLINLHISVFSNKINFISSIFFCIIFRSMYFFLSSTIFIPSAYKYILSDN